MRCQPWTTIHRFYSATITSNISILLLYLKCFHRLHFWICVIIIRYYVKISRVFNRLNIISDCKFSSTKIPTHSTSAEIPTTHETKTTTYHLLSPNSKPSISRNFTSHLTTQSTRMETSNQVIWYIYPLIVTLIILPTTVILFRLIIRCWKSRLSQRPPSVMLHLLPLNVEGGGEDNQSEEDVIFIRTTEL